MNRPPRAPLGLANENLQVVPLLRVYFGQWFDKWLLGKPIKDYDE